MTAEYFHDLLVALANSHQLKLYKFFFYKTLWFWRFARGSLLLGVAQICKSMHGSPTILKKKKKENSYIQANYTQITDSDRGRRP